MPNCGDSGKWLLSTHLGQTCQYIHCLREGRPKNVKSPLHIGTTDLAYSSGPILPGDLGLGCTSLPLEFPSTCSCVGETVTIAAEQQQQRLAALINPRSRTRTTLHHAKPEEKANRKGVLHLCSCCQFRQHCRPRQMRNDRKFRLTLRLIDPFIRIRHLSKRYCSPTTQEGAVLCSAWFDRCRSRFLHDNVLAGGQAQWTL